MIDNRTLELIHREVDGENTSEESARLRVLVERDADARRAFEDFRSLGASLDSLVSSLPPPGLVQGILRSIRREAPAPFRRLSTRSSVLRYGYALAAGLVLGLLLAPAALERLGGPELSDPGDMLGTMARSSRHAESSWTETRDFGANGAYGTVRLHHSQGATLIELDIRSRSAEGVTLGFDSRRLEFAGFEQLSGSPGSGELTPGRWVWSLRGDVRFRILFRRQGQESSSLQLVFTGAAGVLCTETVQLPPAR